jgi:hypothetical protein
MAKVINKDGEYHLRGAVDGETLCQVYVQDAQVEDNMLTCKSCADVALNAIELTTKKERKEWRSL